VIKLYITVKRCIKIKYNINHNYFNVIDTTEKAYWLGFLYADGCITDKNDVILELSNVDVNHIYKFLNSIESDHPIKNPKNRNSSRVTIRSKQLASDLIRMGCTPRKSLTLEYPEWLDTSLDKHFIRGYFDGDGCISRSCYNETRKNRNPENKTIVWTVKFTGTYSFLNSIVTRLNIPSNKIISDGTKGYQLKYGGKKKPLEVLETFYSDNILSLDRKYEKYIEFKNEINTA